MGVISKYFNTVVLFSNQSLFFDTSYLFLKKCRLATFSGIYKEKERFRCDRIIYNICNI